MLGQDSQLPPDESAGSKDITMLGHDSQLPPGPQAGSKDNAVLGQDSQLPPNQQAGSTDPSLQIISAPIPGWLILCNKLLVGKLETMAGAKVMIETYLKLEAKLGYEVRHSI